MKVYIDGQISSGDDARIPVVDHGLLYGDGVFEGIRVFGGKPFMLEEHLTRMAHGLSSVHMALPGGIARLREAVLTTVAAHAEPSAYVRLIATRGDGALGIDPSSCAAPRVICIVDNIKIFPEDERKAGITMATVSTRRPPSDVLDPRVKTLKYLNNVLARVEARQRGAAEALVLNARGHIAEASCANLFVVHGEKVRTPPVTDGCLEGITRGAVLSLAKRLGLAPEERSLGRFDVFSADEVFITGTGAGLVRVRSLDGELIGGPEAPVFMRLLAAYDELTGA